MNKTIKYLLILTLTAFITVVSLPTPTFADTGAYPIYKNGSIIWQAPVGTLYMILGDPGTGGWFQFPYLYTCHSNHILVWNFIEGYPKLIYSYSEPGAKDIVIYHNYMLVQVKDGINIYELETPTTFVTYGGIMPPCDNGHLLWGTSAISPTQATVHVACPDGSIYGLYRWDFKKTENFKDVEHSIPMPPMVWGPIESVLGDMALVSSNVPLFLKTDGYVCSTKDYIITKHSNKVHITDKKPPYNTVYTAHDLKQ